MSEKKALRSAMREARAAFHAGLSGPQREALLVALADQVLGRLPAEGVVSVYSAYGDEIDPALIAAALPGRVAFPYFASRETPMTFRLAGDAPFEGGPFGIAQPPESAVEADPDVLLVPLLAADPLCHRLGQGKGHYDRALAALGARKTFHAIGLAWDVQIVDRVPREEWDVALHAVATPTRWIAAAA